MKSDCIKLTCDFCHNYVYLDIRDTPDNILPLIAQWRGVMDGDSPPPQQPNSADTHRWYDTTECLALGEKRHDEEKRQAGIEQARQQDLLAKANAQLKASPYMTDKAVTVGKA